jgi:hypothetical protein
MLINKIDMSNLVSIEEQYLKVGTNSYDCCYVYDWNK